jgi:hypothetical protein
MASVRDILLQSGVDQYTINSLDERVTGALQNVLSEAELQKTSVDEFWKNTYSPGIAQWEQDRTQMTQRIARAEAEKAALLAERSALAESGIVGAELPINISQQRNSGGQYMPTPGTPVFSNPDEFIGRAAQGFNQILDITHRHQQLYGKPMGIQPSALIAEADRLGISPSELAERKFSFSKREGEIQVQRQKEAEERIRQDERQKMLGRYSDSSGLNANPVQGANGGGMASVRKDMLEGKLKDPTRMSPQERHQQALNSIHRHIEERQQRDA